MSLTWINRFHKLQANIFLTSRAAVGGAAECTLIFHWVQKCQVQSSPPDLVIVLLWFLIIL